MTTYTVGTNDALAAKVGGPREPTFFVANGGSDTADGLTPGSAWQTITKVNAQALTPGQVVAFNGGQTFTGALVVPASGTIGVPIVFTSYGTGRATISSGTAIGIAATNRSYVTIQNLIVTGNGSTNATDGVYILNNQANNTKLPGIILQNLAVSGYGLNGILIYGDNGTSGFVRPQILNCVATANTYGTRPASGGTCGIKVNSMTGYYSGISAPSHTSVLISGCSASLNTGVAGSSDWVGSGIVLGECANSVITNCTAFTNGAANTSSAGPVGIWMYDCDACTITGCETYDNRTTNGTNDGGGQSIDGGCRGCIIEFGFSHDNYGSGFKMFCYTDAALPPTTNSVIRYCLSVNDSKQFSIDLAGIRVENQLTGMTGIQVYNNVIYSSIAGRSCVGIQMTATHDVKLSNNIFYIANTTGLCVSGVGAASTTTLFQGNDYFGTSTNKVTWGGSNYTTVALWRAAHVVQETIAAADTSKISNPLLVNAGGTTSASYRLQAGSPMRGTGLNLFTLNGWSLPTHGYFDTAIPHKSGTGYNIGIDGS